MDFVGVFYVREHPNAQPAMALVLKRQRRQGHSLKSHLTDLEGWESIVAPPTPEGYIHQS